MKLSKSTSVASSVGFTFPGLAAWAPVFFDGGVLQPAMAKPTNNKRKARNLTPAFIGGSFLSFHSNGKRSRDCPVWASELRRSFPAASKTDFQSRLLVMKTAAQGVFNKNKIESADNFLKRRRRTVQGHTPAAEFSENSFWRQRRGPRYPGIMTPKGAELMCI